MAYMLQGKRVISAVTVKVFIEDAAVNFVAKYTDMSKREARKEMARIICGYGSFHDYNYLTVHEGSLQLLSGDGVEIYEEGDDADHIFGYFVYSVVVQ